MHPDKLQLLAYHDGELTARQSQRIAEHLERCDECRRRSELERWQIDRLLGTSRERPPDAVLPRRTQLQGLLRSMNSSPLLLTRSLLSLLVGRRAASREDGWPAGAKVVKPVTAIIYVATLIHVILGMIVWSGWQFTGSTRWARDFFGTAGDLFLVELAAAALYLALQVRRGYAKGEPLYESWFLISMACFCDLVGSIFSKLLATHANPLWPYVNTAALYQFGLFLSGPLRLALLTIGLWGIGRAYYRAGIMTFRLSVLEYIILVPFAAYTVCENIQAMLAPGGGRLWMVEHLIAGSNDPLLLVLLVGALLLRRSIQNLAGKHLARCWTAMVAAFGLILVGNILTWALNYNYISFRVSSLAWNIWFVAGASFPVACAFQLQAMGRAVECLDTGKTSNAPSAITL